MYCQDRLFQLIILLLQLIALRKIYFQDFQRYLKKKIITIYSGIHYKLINAKENDNLKKTLTPKSYYLYVGNLYPHKNVDLIIQAYLKNKVDKNLVICTKKDNFSDRLKKNYL